MSQLGQAAGACPPSAFYSAYPKDDRYQQMVNGGSVPLWPTHYQPRTQHQFPAHNTTILTSQIGSDANDFAPCPQPDSLYSTDFIQDYSIRSNVGRNHVQHPQLSFGPSIVCSGRMMPNLTSACDFDAQYLQYNEVPPFLGNASYETRLLRLSSTFATADSLAELDHWDSNGHVPGPWDMNDSSALGSISSLHHGNLTVPQISTPELVNDILYSSPTDAMSNSEAHSSHRPRQCREGPNSTLQDLPIDLDFSGMEVRNTPVCPLRENPPSALAPFRYTHLEGPNKESGTIIPNLDTHISTSTVTVTSDLNVLSPCHASRGRKYPSPKSVAISKNSNSFLESSNIQLPQQDQRTSNRSVKRKRPGPQSMDMSKKAKMSAVPKEQLQPNREVELMAKELNQPCLRCKAAKYKVRLLRHLQF